MFGYYFKLALRSFGRNRILTALMVLAIALGIGAAMTTLTVFKVLSGDPIPHKSDRLFYVQLDPALREGYLPGEEPESQLTRFDAEELLRQRKAPRQAMMTGGGGIVDPRIDALKPFSVSMRYTSADFFPMFDTPFQFGQGWSGDDDQGRGRVAVISKTLNDKLFQGANSVGNDVLVEGNALRIVGVLEQWAPAPKFYDLYSGKYDSGEEVFVPFSTSRELKLGRSGNMNCFGREAINDNEALNVPCAWIQYWVELDSPADAAGYKAYLDNYSEQQRASGRFERPANTRLRNVMELMEHRNAVPGDVRLQMWLAFGFLLVCLVNTVGLLLAKFLRRSGEIGVRRALGASRAEIFKQCLVEAGTIGLAGGLLGLVFALAGLWAVRQRPAEYASLAHLDGSMLLMTFALAVLASMLAGILPAWRAMQVAPALQLKSQ
ncbi:ABC transporter ATP-binding protein [Stenotrophomonas pictorum JCM 9942]|uniref:ABC transporter ATP-binding protein n=1 Tax=Stenotrophomonas pictorum JCM 9942 TaxID=1236960 RepID=A0A0R0AGW3_9GAMM|nr:ABC transporter permease [Stenotrophomonas pictorum]KRG40104.1 ABC transporter ATP-binding protein [Stenotrophomonas pictorum JCM 9942]